MLDTFLKLVEKIIDLVKVRKERKREAFDDIIEPLFLEMRPVVDEYFRLFRGSLERVRQADETQLSAAVSEIVMQRGRLIQLRSTVLTMAHVIGEEIPDSGVQEFAAKVRDFFLSSSVRPRRSHLTGVVEVCEYVMAEGFLKKGDLVEFLDATLINLERSWISVAECYARLRIRCLTS